MTLATLVNLEACRYAGPMLSPPAIEQAPSARHGAADAREVGGSVCWGRDAPIPGCNLSHFSPARAQARTRAQAPAFAAAAAWRVKRRARSCVGVERGWGASKGRGVEGGGGRHCLGVDHCLGIEGRGVEGGGLARGGEQGPGCRGRCWSRP